MPNGFPQRQSQAGKEKKRVIGKEIEAACKTQDAEIRHTTRTLLASGLAAGLCPICCTEPQLAGSPAASMYQYGAGAGIRCDTSVLVPAVTLLVGETPQHREKRRWAALQGFPVQFPRPPARNPRARLSPRPAFSALN